MQDTQEHEGGEGFVYYEGNLVPYSSLTAAQKKDFDLTAQISAAARKIRSNINRASREDVITQETPANYTPIPPMQPIRPIR